MRPAGATGIRSGCSDRQAVSRDREISSTRALAGAWQAPALQHSLTVMFFKMMMKHGRSGTAEWSSIIMIMHRVSRRALLQGGRWHRSGRRDQPGLRLVPGERRGVGQFDFALDSGRRSRLHVRGQQAGFLGQARSRRQHHPRVRVGRSGKERRIEALRIWPGRSRRDDQGVDRRASAGLDRHGQSAIAGDHPIAEGFGHRASRRIWRASGWAEALRRALPTTFGRPLRGPTASTRSRSGWCRCSPA